MERNNTQFFDVVKEPVYDVPSILKDVIPISNMFGIYFNIDKSFEQNVNGLSPFIS